MRLTSWGLAISLSFAQAAHFPSKNVPIDTGSIWEDLAVRPDVNATGHLVFDTVISLLQHWPNTRYRNGTLRASGHEAIVQSPCTGHNIVPGNILAGMLLYHGRADSDLPKVPEWTSIDPEHSHPFCSRPGDKSFTECWHLTIVVTRPLKVLYFDGSSAAKMEDGPLDAQDLLVWGEVNPSRRRDERARINDLCAWGKEFGIDGYVRQVPLV